MSCLFPWEGSTGTWLVDSERASFPSDASQLNIASYNARAPPPIRPHPPRHHTLLRYMSHSPKVGLYLVVYGYEKTYRTARAGDLGAGIAQKIFMQKPYVHGFPDTPTSVDPAHHAVGPLSPLPCQAKHGYGVSNAKHGEARGCRRACESTPLRGRRRCAAGGRHIMVSVVSSCEW
jgi:hypothetical protein